MALSVAVVQRRTSSRGTPRSGTCLPVRIATCAATERIGVDAMFATNAPVVRATPADLMQLATEAGPAPMMVGAVLVLSTGAGFSVERAREMLGERIRAVPRLRQRLYRAPPGCGRPFWADDPAFDVRRHVFQARCPAPGDERSLLDAAAAVITTPLPRSRPLWSATFVTGLVGGSTGLVIVMDHVLADGIGGLAVLARLVDDSAGLPTGGQPPFPAPAPMALALAADAWAARAYRLAHLADSVRTIRQGLAELGGGRAPRGVHPTSLNRPTGPRRRLDVVAADLAAVRELGHACGGTVNDVVLAAVAGALRTLLAGRGEELDPVTVSVPVSARRSDTAGVLGNQVGGMLVTLRTAGGLADRVTRAAAVTSERKRSVRGTSVTVLGPLVRLLAAVGFWRWFTNHQRLVHTFVTNVRGPAEPLAFAGAPVVAVLPVPATTGNVSVSFAALSYAGTLWLTVLSDPALVPDAAELTGALRRELGDTRRARGSAGRGGKMYGFT
jgi:diacylglycerol O-acyltransferase / wax synthase